MFPERHGSPARITAAPRPRHGVRAWPFLLALALTPVSGIRAQDFPPTHALGAADWALLPTGLGVFGLGLHLAGETPTLFPEEIARLNPGQVNGFDRVATGHWSRSWDHAGDRSLAFLLGLATVVGSVEGVRAWDRGEAADAAAVGVMALEVASLTAGATYLTKGMARRKRPFLYNQELSVEERQALGADPENTAHLSFFSGHAAFSFAAASFTSTLLTHVHGRSLGTSLVWGSTLSLAAFTSYARVRAGVHYPTDVLVGALVGGGIGYLVPRLHRQKGGASEGAGPGPLVIGFRFSF